MVQRTCIIVEDGAVCGRAAVAHEWCGKHYNRWKTHGDPLAPGVKRRVRLVEDAGICRIPECEDPVKIKSLKLCGTHYQRERNGVPMDAPRRDVVYGPPEVRFWAKVLKDSGIIGDKPELGECWVWTGYIDEREGHVDPVNGYGYGLFALTASDTRSAHRFGYELQIGPIPPRLELDHLCRIRCCVRGTHLEPVTERENVLRSPTAPSAVNAAKTRCIRDHPLEGDNLVIDAQGKRQCRICNRLRKLGIAWAV